jgi:hypothetical protein
VARPLTERRVHSRFGHPTTTRLKAVLRPGHTVEIVNLSAGGALLDGHRPLRPGSKVFLQITLADQTAGRRGHVVRSMVASIRGADGVQYRSAIRFDDQWESLWEQCTLDGYGLPGLADRFEMVDGQRLPASLDSSDSAPEATGK